MQFKAVRDFGGYAFAVIEVETGEPAELGHDTWEEAVKAAKNFNEAWN